MGGVTRRVIIYVVGVMVFICFVTTIFSIPINCLQVTIFGVICVYLVVVTFTIVVEGFGTTIFVRDELYGDHFGSHPTYGITATKVGYYRRPRIVSIYGRLQVGGNK